MISQICSVRRYTDLPSGYDLTSFAYQGSGLYAANILRTSLHLLR